METQKFELISELSHALSILTHCHPAIMRVYNVNRGKYFAAAQACPEKRRPAISCGRAEHQIMALRAMGILCAGSADDINIILRAASKEAYDRLVSHNPSEPVRIDDYITDHSHESNDVFYARVVVVMGICAVRKLTAQPGGIVNMVLENISNRDRASVNYQSATPYDHSYCRHLFGSKDIHSVSSIYDAVPDDVRSNLEYLMLAFCAEGIDAGVYTTDVYLKPNDAHLIAKSGDQTVSAYVAASLLMIRAIKRDRSFCLDQLRDDKEAAALSLLSEKNAELENERRINREHERQLTVLRDKLLENERRLNVLETELSTHADDTTELSSLRTALYESAQSDDVIVHETVLRIIPDGVIVIGGHPSWAKALSESVNVRVWPSGTTCPASVIRAASEVWIQANYMDHSSFYAAIDLIRSNGKDVHYFGGSGLSRCIADLRRENR